MKNLKNIHIYGRNNEGLINRITLYFDTINEYSNQDISQSMFDKLYKTCNGRYLFDDKDCSDENMSYEDIPNLIWEIFFSLTKSSNFISEVKKHVDM